MLSAAAVGDYVGGPIDPRKIPRLVAARRRGGAAAWGRGGAGAGGAEKLKLS